jgi:hypothetical protein
MIAELFLPVCLAGLAIFILWESWRRRHAAPLPRASMANGFTPGATNREVTWFTLAIAAGAAGLALFLKPPSPPFTGKGGLFLELIHTQMGEFAIPTLVCAGAVGAFWAGVTARRRRTNEGADAS